MKLSTAMRALVGLESGREAEVLGLGVAGVVEGLCVRDRDGVGEPSLVVGVAVLVAVVSTVGSGWVPRSGSSVQPAARTLAIVSATAVRACPRAMRAMLAAWERPPPDTCGQPPALAGLPR
jgi:hypothetical protein